MFRFKPSKAPQASRKVKLMRMATGMATSAYSTGGNEKGNRAYKPKPVTLPTLETARRITKENDQ